VTLASLCGRLAGRELIVTREGDADLTTRGRLDEMRKLVVQQFVTLDGYAAGPNGELDFVTESGADADPTSGPFVDEQRAFIESLDTILLGAVTYRMFAAYWPEQTRRRRRSRMR
jgi:hypothetical protein